MKGEIEKLRADKSDALKKKFFIFSPDSWESVVYWSKFLASCIGLIFYTWLGGWIFQQIELPAELTRLQNLQTSLQLQRMTFISSVVNESSTEKLENLVRALLRPYELAVQEAVRGGINIETIPEFESHDHGIIKYEPITPVRWNGVQAFFFASTVLTTIGYGNVVPNTFFGRLFCIIYAVVGIPFTLTVMAECGKILADKALQKIYNNLPSGLKALFESDFRGKAVLIASLAIIFLFLYVALGSVIFLYLEDEWSFFDGFYFCFITMTTIGFGDLVPSSKKPKYMIFCALYIFIGLALTSMIIELVRRQYADSWQHIQALSEALSVTLRRFGEHAGGDISFIHSDLNKYKNAIMSIPMHLPQRRKSGIKAIEAVREVFLQPQNIATVNNKPAQEIIIPEARLMVPNTDEPILRVVIYETSV